MLQRHFTQFGVSSRNNVARDGSNYLRPEIWPVDHIVNCGIQYTLYWNIARHGQLTLSQ